jgi:TetR/AcrR family transcriptional regulator, ethionamide resistance regulator
MVRWVEASMQQRRGRRSPLAGRRGDVRESAILETAERLLRAGEFEVASVDDLARSAGISRPTFYFYFASKEALIIGVVRRALDHIVMALEAALDRGSDRTTPQALLRSVAAVWREHGPEMCAAIEIAPRSPVVLEQWAVIVEAPLEPLVAYVMQMGTVPEARDRGAAIALAGTLVWMTERNFYRAVRAGMGPAELDALADRLATVLERTFGITDGK